MINNSTGHLGKTMYAFSRFFVVSRKIILNIGCLAEESSLISTNYFRLRKNGKKSQLTLVSQILVGK